MAHIIFDLGRGGAETMLVSVVNELNDYENTIITLFDTHHFKDELQCDHFYCLNLKMTDLIFFPVVVYRLRKLLKKNQPDLIHTHLYWPTVLTRLAAPSKIPIITTIHAFVSQLVDYRKWYFKWFDQFTYKLRSTTIIAVAKGALDEYFSFLKLKRHKNYFLYTFVDINKFQAQERQTSPDGIFSLVNVGAIRLQKNQSYLLDAMKKMSTKDVQLHIYGIGPLEQQLEKIIAGNTLTHVQLKGQVNNIRQVLPKYDVYVMSSIYEGFSLSVLEAMAMKIPLLLSDIPSFREQCEDTAMYFKLTDTNDLIQKINWMKQHPHEISEMAKRAAERVVQNFTLQHHLQKLRMIYAEVLQKK